MYDLPSQYHRGLKDLGIPNNHALHRLANSLVRIGIVLLGTLPLRLAALRTLTSPCAFTCFVSIPVLSVEGRIYLYQAGSRRLAAFPRQASVILNVPASFLRPRRQSIYQG